MGPPQGRKGEAEPLAEGVPQSLLEVHRESARLRETLEGAGRQAGCESKSWQGRGGGEAEPARSGAAATIFQEPTSTEAGMGPRWKDGLCMATGQRTKQERFVLFPG